MTESPAPSPQYRHGWAADSAEPRRSAGESAVRREGDKAAVATASAVDTYDAFGAVRSSLHSGASSARPFQSRRVWFLTATTLTLVVLGVVGAAALPRGRALPIDKVRVIARFPHDAQAFTQGLVIHQGVLYEGTGLKGQSSLREVDLPTGRPIRLQPLHPDYFGEGIAVLGQRLYQLTYQNRLAIVYDLATFQPVTSFRYAGEGWGLTTDGTHLILSDGTPVLRFLDPATGDVVRRVTVRTSQGQIEKLNELEFIRGEIYANIWYSDMVARIDPKSGDVLGWIDLSPLYPARQRPSREHVLNGIAYDADARRLFVTGKNWPELFEIEVLRP
jgi:glutaminyl-peptide cyclotransferase